MTDNEIIEALECCVKDDEGKKGFCNENCPLFGEGYICADLLRSKTLDVIKRQQKQIKKLETIERFATKTIEKQEKEIERLTVNKNAFALGMKRLSEQLETAKPEAIKEFAERLKQKIQESKYRVNDSPYARACNQVADWCIEVGDNLVKEMTEGCENG